jgi:hypothetical protein
MNQGFKRLVQNSRGELPTPTFPTFRTRNYTSVTVVQSEPESFRTDENLHFTN